MKAADPLDSDDLTVEQRSRRLLKWVLAARFGQPHARAALRACVRLGVETTIARVLVFRPALRAHLEGRHRRAGPVVGHALDDREARAAVGAVDERVAKAPILLVMELGETVITGG